MLVLQDQEWLPFWEKCSFAHRQFDEQPTKRSKKNDDKSAVAILKKGDWQERGPVTDQCHDRSGKPDKMSDKKLGQNSSKRRSSNARQLGCVFQDMTPRKSILRKCTDMRKPIRCVKFTKAVVRHADIRDQNPSLGMICPGDLHQRNPNAPKIEDRSQEEHRQVDEQPGKRCKKNGDKSAVVMLKRVIGMKVARVDNVVQGEESDANSSGDDSIVDVVGDVFVPDTAWDGADRRPCDSQYSQVQMLKSPLKFG